MGKKVLIPGSGGREHALYWKLQQSTAVKRVICARGNGGIVAQDRRKDVNEKDVGAILALANDERPHLVVIGPEDPLVAGLTDELESAGHKVFGPSKAAAVLEGSKIFTKQLCVELGIPTAEYRHATSMTQVETIIREWGVPLVVKADGLCAGKGVTVAKTTKEAIAAAAQCLSERFFGHAGDLIILERCLVGREASIMFICDGEDARGFPAIRDFKRVGNDDMGPNTGGMGAFSPLPDVGPHLVEDVRQRMILPTLRLMMERGTPFKGCLYAGIMLTREGPMLLEYNVRFGDPETQVAMALLDCDLFEQLEGAATYGGLSSVPRMRFSDQAVVNVVLAANGYPGTPETGKAITGIEKAELVFHAGTDLRPGLMNTGGRVLSVIGRGSTVARARENAYTNVRKIGFDGQFRTDIAAGV